jgi:hypothetical protein
MDQKMENKYVLFKRKKIINEYFTNHMNDDKKKGVLFECFNSSTYANLGLNFFIKNKTSSWFVKKEWIEPAPEHLVVAARLRGEL